MKASEAAENGFPMGDVIYALGERDLEILVLRAEIIKLKHLNPIVQLPEGHLGFAVPERRTEKT